MQKGGIQMPRKSVVVFFVILLLAIFGTATFVLTKPYKATLQAKPSSTLLAKVSSLIPDGKTALYSHNVLSAKAKFLEAVTADPTNQEAQMLFGVVRVMAIYEEGQNKKTPGLDSIREIAELAGVRFSEYGVYTTSISSTSEQLPATTPKTADAFNFLKEKVLTEIDGAIDNLGKVSNINFVSEINPTAINKSGPALNIDYADVLLLKAFLYGAKANIELLLAYNLDVNPTKVQSTLNGEADKLIALRNILMYYPKFVTPKEPARLTASKNAVIAGIDTYSAAIGYITDRITPGHHLFILDEPMDDELAQSTATEQEALTKILSEIKASLSGSKEWIDTFPDRTTEQRTFDLSKFFNESDPINFRQLFMNTNANLFVSNNTVKGMVPHGIAQFISYPAPEIFQSQENGSLGRPVILWGRGFTPDKNVTISIIHSDGTNAPDITVSTDNIGQFNYVFTIPSTMPEGIYQWRARDTQTSFQTAYLTLPVAMGNKMSEYRLKVAPSSSKKGTGGIPSSDGMISCGNGGIDCEFMYSDGTPVVLEATPDERSVFAGWTPTSLGCSTDLICGFAMNKKMSVKAKFTGPNKLKVKVVSKKGGLGSVASDITGLDGNLIDCPEISCQNEYVLTEAVTLTATADGGSTFLGWKPTSLGCRMESICQVTMDRARSVQAVFGPPAP